MSDKSKPARRDAGGNPIPMLNFTEAEGVGGALHDRIFELTGQQPMPRDNLSWADLVQFVLARAAESFSAHDEQGDEG